MATEMRRTSIARLSTDGDNNVLDLRAARVKTMRQKSARNK